LFAQIVLHTSPVQTNLCNQKAFIAFFVQNVCASFEPFRDNVVQKNADRAEGFRV